MERDRLTTPRLQEWLRLTETPLDLLALCTIWLTILPFTTVTDTDGLTWWVIGRIALSSIYGIDIVVRARLSTRPMRYVLGHPVACLSVVVPTVRIIFSLRLLQAMFRKGALGHFLFVALLLILNGVIMVYAFEDNAPGANIHTVWESLWWAAVTVATVGYGDLYPVSVGGRITAVALMGVGLVTAAVITAQIASTFMDQAQARRTALAAASVAVAETEGEGEIAAEVVTAAEAHDEASLHERLDRIEALLRARMAEDGSASPPG